MNLEGYDVVWNGAHQNCDADLFNRTLVEPHKTLGNLSDDLRKTRAFDSRAEAWKVLVRAGAEGVTLKALAQRAKFSRGTAYEVTKAFLQQGRITRESRRVANNSVNGGSTEYVYRLVEVHSHAK